MKVTLLEPGGKVSVIDVLKPKRGPKRVKEYKVVALRECPFTLESQVLDNPENVSRFWEQEIKRHPYFNPECECLVTLFVNTRRRLKGFNFVTHGTQDTLLIHPREVFRTAVVAAAAAIVLIHNHPSGDPTPSEADIKVTRDLIRAGQLLKTEVLDHVIMGTATLERPKPYSSLRELGYFYS